jgi:acyl-CoA oxidase
VGSDEQVKQLDAMQAAGQLGCFALTEKFAGVNSGLVVQTKATYDAPTGEFVLQTPTPGAQKNWISQGLVADKAVVVADMVVGGKSVGPHAFLMDLRKNGQLVKGVSLTDMGKKTVGNDLDNVSINFEGVRMPRSSLLSRFAEVTAEGQYVSKSKVPTMVMIGQRLFSGRVAVAQAALEYRRGLFEMTRAYSDRKKCWSPAGTPTLSSLPHIAALYQECEPRAERLEAFARKCEEQLNVCLRKDAIPPVPLMDAIAVAKFSAVDESIDMCFRLKKEVGSYALMAGAGFDQMDFLSCCAFAEGDSRILKMKLARDRLRDFQKAGTVGSPQEDELCRAISSGMADHVAASPADKQGAMDAQWRLMYQLADASAHRIIEQTLAA